MAEKSTMYILRAGPLKHFVPDDEHERLIAEERTRLLDKIADDTAHLEPTGRRPYSVRAALYKLLCLERGVPKETLSAAANALGLKGVRPPLPIVAPEASQTPHDRKYCMAVIADAQAYVRVKHGRGTPYEIKYQPKAFGLSNRYLASLIGASENVTARWRKSEGYKNDFRTAVACTAVVPSTEDDDSSVIDRAVYWTHLSR